jgi:hypothetical protein
MRASIAPTTPSYGNLTKPITRPDLSACCSAHTCTQAILTMLNDQTEHRKPKSMMPNKVDGPSETKLAALKIKLMLLSLEPAINFLCKLTNL